MIWIHLKLCLCVVVLLTPYLVSAEDNANSNLNNDEELLPFEQIIEQRDVPTAKEEERRASAQPARTLLRQSNVSDFNRNVGSSTGIQLARGHIAAPQDSQAASASNKVVLVLNNDKNKFAGLAKPTEESLKRMARNPDVMEDIVGQFQQLGGGMTQQFLQQVSQTAPDMSRSFGQALNEALTQTNLLAQVAPGSIDLAQLGQSLSQSFLLGAAPNFLNPNKAQTSTVASAAPAAEEDGAQSVASTGPEAESESARESKAMDPQAPKNPATQIVGTPLFPQLPRLNLAHPFGMLGPLYALSPLMPLGSEISEVRVLPEQYSPYKISPKPVDRQTIAEMKLKAVLKESLTKKTIPILWFHLPTKQNLQKTDEDLEMEAKLEIFEQQVVAELKQLQELSKMANDLKRAQLESGAQPTTSLTAKLNLFEIPVYDITLGDIEKTLQDEHVKILMQTIVQKQSKGFHRHQQATTKYLTDLTGTPIKRQAKSPEDAFKTMEKDDMMKMMAYAYRMAALNGHEMPWLKKVTTLDEKEAAKISMTSQERQFTAANEEMTAERQWLEDKRKQMAIEAGKQRQKLEDGQQKMVHDHLRYWADPHMVQQQMSAQRQMSPQMQQQMPFQREVMSSQMQEHMSTQREMMPPQMQQQITVERQMMPPQMQQEMHIQREMMSSQMQEQMPSQRQMMPPQIQEQMPSQREMMPPQMQQQVPVGRQMMPPQMPPQREMMPSQMQQQVPGGRQMMPPQMQQQTSSQREMMPPEMQQHMAFQRDMMSPQMHEQMPFQREMMPPQMQQQMPVEEQMIPPQMQPHMTVGRQMMPPQMQEQMTSQREMMPPPQMPEEKQMIPQQIQQHMPVERQMIPPQMEEPMTSQREMMPPAHMQQQMPEERQTIPQQMQQHMPVGRQMMPPQMQEQISQREMMTPAHMQQQMPEERQMILQQMQQHMPVGRQMMPPQMQEQMTSQREMMPPPQMPVERQMIPPQMQRHMPVGRQMMPPQIQEQMFQREMMPPPHMQQQMPFQRDMMSSQMPSQGEIMPPKMQKQMPLQREMIPPHMQQPKRIENQTLDPNMPLQQPMMTNLKMQQQMPMQRQEQESLMQQQRELNGTSRPQAAEQRQSVELSVNKQSNAEKQPLPEPTTALQKADQVPEQRQQIDIKTSENATTQDMRMDKMSLLGDAKPQLAENDGKARHAGIQHLFDNLNVFGFGNHRRPDTGKPSTIVNYYYNTDTHRYKPAYGPAGTYSHTRGYKGGYVYPYSSQYYPAYGHYGRGAHGSNAYGSSFGAYRTATGDEEIAAMLQQHQRMPKMMMMLNNEEHTPTTETKNDTDNAVDLNKKHSKRLANKQVKSYKSPAAYLIVLRNNDSKKSRSRRKRSTEYATLEPIDEKSLSVLRKTYKNSLKEITLNPNETPAEALMRYNAESIREALEKASKQPIEISTGGETEEVKEKKKPNVVGQHSNQQSVQQQNRKELTQDNDNDQFVPVSDEPEPPISNEPYATLPVDMQQTKPLYVSFNQQQQAVYDHDANQEGFFNNIISKYNAPGVFGNNKIVISSLEPVPYIDDYGVSIQKPDTQSQFTYNNFFSPQTVSPSNALSKTHQYLSTSDHNIVDYDKDKILHYENFVKEWPSTDSHVITKNAYVDSYIPIRQPQVDLFNRYRPQESSSFENIMAFIQEQLVQCCDKCKHNILKVLEETFKHKYYGGGGGGGKPDILEANIKPYSTFTDEPHTLTYRKPNKGNDFEYQQWLMEMSEKGYNKSHLTKQHQRDYLKDGKVNLHLEYGQDFTHEVENIFNKNNQSYKRETNIPGNIVTAAVENTYRREKLEEGEVKDEVKSEEDEVETEKQTANEGKDKKPPKLIKKRNEQIETEKNDASKKEKTQNLNVTKTVDTTETTSRSAYELRGQFRSHEANPMAFTLKQGKQFSNYKNINKLGSANILAKTKNNENSPDKSDKLEEILDVFYDLSQQSKETLKETSVEENSKAMISSSYTTIPSPTTSADNIITKASNATNTSTGTKLSRRKTKLLSKGRKLENRNQTSSSLPFPSTTPTSPLPTVATSSSGSSSSLSPSLPKSSNDSAPEVGSLFAYDPHILKPFMGLHGVDRPDDPWHHKAYNLYQPLYTGGGTFEQHIKTERYKRDLGSTVTQSDFKKHYPTLYKQLADQLYKGKTTRTISITPPGVPQHVSHKNLELAAAEINPLESLIYQEDLTKIMEGQKQKHLGPHDSVINSYKNGFILRGNSREDATSITPTKDTHILPSPIQEQLPEDAHNTLKAVGAKQSVLGNTEKFSFKEPQRFWENSQETLKNLTDLQLFLANRQGNPHEFAILKDISQDFVNEPQSFWEDSQQSLKTLNDQPVLFNNFQDTAIKEQSLWQIPDHFQNDTHILHEKIQASVKDEHSLWEPSALQKRNSFWAELEASEERKEHKQKYLDDSEPIFDFDEDFD